MVMTVEQYGRLQLCFDGDEGVEAVEYELPDGTTERGPVFADQPIRLEYDEHGFETTHAQGAPRLCTRYTPAAPGHYSWRALRGGEALHSGEFDCVAGSHPGYVQVSSRDPRYFALSDGSSYVPIGLNIVDVTWHPLPGSMEHFVRSGQRATCGMRTWRRWFRELSENGGNYARIWISRDYTDGRTETPGRHDLIPFAHLDAVVEEARSRGIRLKLCLDHFRHFDRPGHFAHKVLRDPDTGEALESVAQWLRSPRWRQLWLADAQPYLARYWNDPVVFAWELWNEMNAVDAPFDDVCDWTEHMLARIKAASPRSLTANSLGSADEPKAYGQHRRFQAMAHMDIDQVHRYLDQGAPLAVCRTDPVAFSVESVIMGSGRRPVILTETGAVDDRHIGPFRFYDCDHDGLIFTDCTYPAFFAGAAGSGHIWHWNEYVERKNLWPLYRPLAQALRGVACDAEGFRTVDHSTDAAWVLGLEGRTCALWFVRSKADRWDHVLRDGGSPAQAPGVAIPWAGAVQATAWGLCGEAAPPVDVQHGVVQVGAFTHGCVIRVQKHT